MTKSMEQILTGGNWDDFQSDLEALDFDWGGELLGDWLDSAEVGGSGIGCWEGSDWRNDCWGPVNRLLKGNWGRKLAV